MKFKISQRHISEGKPDDPCGCAIALAVEEQLHCPIYVGTSILCTEGQEFPLPPNARAFIQRYDNGLPVEPFEFSLAGL